MFRLALLGVACLTLAAYALVRNSANLPEILPLDPDQNKDPNPPRDFLRRFPALAFHAGFSVN